MRTNKSFLTASLLTVLGLFLAGCAPAVAPTPKPTAPAPRAETPAAKPATTPAAPALTPKPAADEARPGGTLKMATYLDEATFDLHTIGRTLAFEQASLSYSTLLQYDPTDGSKIIDDLAESYQLSPDGKKVTFVLRKGVRWHDGKAFSSEDVKFNFDRWMKPPEGVTIIRKEIVAPVDRVETPNADTVEVYLKYPNASFIPMIAMAPALILPPHFLKENKVMGYNVLGTGPFKLKKYTRGVSVEHVKNEDYFVKGRPYMDGVVQYMVPDPSARLAALRTGGVKMFYIAIGNMTPSQGEMIRTQYGDRINVARFIGLGHLVIYINVTKPPFNNVKVRQAMDMVLDRKKAIEVAEGRAVISALMPPGAWALPQDDLAKRPGYKGVTADDIQKAKALLAEAGYPDGIKTTTTSTSQYTKHAVFGQDQLKAIGIQLEIQTVDQPTLDRRLLDADFDLVVYPITVPINDPDSFLALAAGGGGRNYGRFSDKQVDDWYAEQSRTIDEAKRKDLVQKIQVRVLEQAGLPILYTLLIDLPYWKCIRGFYPEKQFGYSNNLKKQDMWLAEGCR